MNLVHRSHLRDFVVIFCRCYSWQKKNHYEVLKLQKSCSSKDIKDAFIKMSKEFHPDKNKSDHAQAEFVKIVEAYNVLSKPSSRATYDMSIAVRSHTPYASSQRNASYAKPRHYNNVHENIFYDQYTTGQTFSQKQQAERQQRANEQFYWRHDTKSQEQHHRAETVRPFRIPNSYLVITCLGFAFFGFLLEVFILKLSYTSNRRRANEKSQLIAEEYKKVRAAALQNGNELQTRLMLEKIAVGSNPSVATASLGQALANEKK